MSISSLSTSRLEDACQAGREILASVKPRAEQLTEAIASIEAARNPLWQRYLQLTAGGGLTPESHAQICELYNASIRLVGELVAKRWVA